VLTESLDTCEVYLVSEFLLALEVLSYDCLLKVY